MIPAPSPSSSTLSPLAHPFTVELHSSAHGLRSYCHPPPPTPEFTGDESSPGMSVGESSSWMDRSLPYNVSPFHKGNTAESFIPYVEAYDAWHRKHVDSSARQVHIGTDSLAWLDKHPAIYEKDMHSRNNGMSYFQLSSPNVAMNECDTSTSSYDRYMSQLVSCSTDPVVYYPASTCSSSPELFTPSNDPMYFVPSNCYSTPQYGNLLHSVDNNYVDYMMCNKKEPGMDQYSDGREGHSKGGTTQDKMKEYNGTVTSSTTVACSSVGNDMRPHNSMDYSKEVKCGFGTKHLNFTEPMACASRPASSLKTSSEILDQPHLAVDSPCWKGSTVSQQYSFGGAEMIGPHQEVNESKGCDDLDQGQNYLPISGQYLRTAPFLERVEGCNVRAPLSFRRDLSRNLKGSESTNVGKEMSSHVSSVSSDRKIEEKEYELVTRNGNQSNEVKTVNFMLSSASHSCDIEGIQARRGFIDATHDEQFDPNLDADGHLRNFSVPIAVSGQIAKPIDPTDPTSKCLTSGRDIRLLLKAMHGLSEVLLSSSYNDGVNWKECDDELVQLVVDNMETFISRNKKDISKGSSHAPGNEQGQARVSVSKFNGTVNNQRNGETNDAEGKFSHTTSCMNDDDFDVRSVNVKEQVSVKDLENDVFVKKEDNPQAVLYKSLWMQAEASLCSMKYELQLARLKLRMENYDSQTKAKEHGQVTGSPMLNCMQGFDSPHVNGAGESSEGNPKGPKTSNDDKVDASVMARLDILKNRYARSNNISMEDRSNYSNTESAFRELSTMLADLGFVESSTPKPFGDVSRDALSSASDVMPAEMHLAPNYSVETPALVGIADGLFPQPFMPSMCNQKNAMRFILG